MSRTVPALLFPFFTICGAMALLSSCGSPVPVRWTHDDGTVMATGTVVSSMQTGPWVYYYRGGAKQAEGAWQDDKQIGPWTWWHADGAKQYSGGYAPGGLRDGLWTSWHANGTQASTGTYRRDRQEGLWRSWHADGSKATVGEFANGVRQGWWQEWSAGGAPVSAGLYLDGAPVGPWIRVIDGVATLVNEPLNDGLLLAIDGNTWRVTSTDQRCAGTLTMGSDGLPTASTISCAGQAIRWIPEDQERAGFAVRTAAAPAPVAAPIPAPSTPASSTPASSTAADPAPMPVLTSNAVVSPTPVVPLFWTEREKRTVGQLVAAYTNDAPIEGGGLYGGSTTLATGGDSDSKKLIGTKLEQTRFLSSTGTVLDITRSGKPTVLVIMRGFSGQVCIYCASQTAALARAQQRFIDAGAELAVIYPGPTESVPAFVQAVQSLRGEPPPMPIGLDVSLRLVRTLRIEGNLAIPTSLVVSPAGIITYAYIGKKAADRPSVETLLKAATAAVK